MNVPRGLQPALDTLDRLTQAMEFGFAELAAGRAVSGAREELIPGALAVSAKLRDVAAQIEAMAARAKNEDN